MRLRVCVCVCVKDKEGRKTEKGDNVGEESKSTSISFP